MRATGGAQMPESSGRWGRAPSPSVPLATYLFPLVVVWMDGDVSWVESELGGAPATKDRAEKNERSDREQPERKLLAPRFRRFTTHRAAGLSFLLRPPRVCLLSLAPPPASGLTLASLAPRPAQEDRQLFPPPHDAVQFRERRVGDRDPGAAQRERESRGDCVCARGLLCTGSKGRGG